MAGEAVPAVAEFCGTDLMLLALFFISYSVLALVQLANLFAGRFVLFAGLGAGLCVLALILGALDYGNFCATAGSALVCGNGADGLRAMGLLWGVVSLAMLGGFALSRGISRWRGGA